MATLEKVNGKMVSATIAHGEQLLARRGAMLAYTGEVGFFPSMTGGAGGLGGFVGRMVAGESVPLMVCQGQGTVLYGHAGLQVKIVQLTGESLSVEADKLLLYEASLQAGTQLLSQNGGLRAVVQGQMTGQGLFTTILSGHGHAVLLSHGPVFEIPIGGQPVAVDPQAYVGHVGAVDLRLEANVSWRDAVGKGSGEAFQLKLTGSGTVYVQASEVKI